MLVLVVGLIEKIKRYTAENQGVRGLIAMLWRMANIDPDVTAPP
jgi:hypothetical protein